MEQTFSITLGNKVFPRSKTWKQNMYYSCRPLIWLGTCVGVPMYRHAGAKIVPPKLINKIYALVLVLILCVPMLISYPSSYVLTKRELPLHFLNVSNNICRFFEINYVIVWTSFFNSKLYIEMWKRINFVDSHLCVGTRYVYNKIRLFSWFHVISAVALTAATYLITIVTYNLPITLGTHVLHLLLLISNTHVCIMAFILANLLLRHRLLNTILERKIRSDELRKFDLWRGTDRSIEKFLEIIMNLRSSIFKAPSRRTYCLYELMMMYNKTSEAFQLFNSIYGSQMVFMTGTLLIVTLFAICRAFSPAMAGNYSWLYDLAWYFCLNFRVLLLVGYCELVRREQTRTEYFLHTLLVHDERDSIYKSQLSTFLLLTQTQRRFHQVSARQLFNMDMSLLSNVAGNIFSYAVLLIQNFYLYHKM